MQNDASELICIIPKLTIESQVVERIDDFIYPGGLTNPNWLVSGKILAQIQKARLAFANLRNLWGRRDIHLLTKVIVHCTSSPFVLFYRCET